MITRIATEIDLGILRRSHRNIVDQTTGVEQFKSTYCIEVNRNFHSILYFIDALARLSLNDRARQAIYFIDPEFKASLCAILVNSIDPEMTHLLRLIAQLSFNERIAEDMLAFPQLAEAIAQLKVDYHFEKYEIEYAQVVWNLRQVDARFALDTDNLFDPAPSVALASLRLVRESSRRSSTFKGPYVMISCTRECKEICLKIKRLLESTNQKVCLEVENSSSKSMIVLIQTKFGSIRSNTNARA